MEIRHFIPTLLILLALSTPPSVGASPAEPVLSKGQTVYVPVYSHIYIGPKKQHFQLSSTLSVRNTDMAGSFRITAVDYYDNNGRLVKRLLAKPAPLTALASADFHIEMNDVTGGFGANFIVRWEADRQINAPVIECVMIGSTIGQGISFVSSGRVIQP